MKGLVVLVGLVVVGVVCALPAPVSHAELMPTTNSMQAEGAPADDDMVGGFGVVERTNGPNAGVWPQSTLIQLEEGPADLLPLDKIGGHADVVDERDEAQRSKGSKAVMSNSGLGHMVGENSPTIHDVRPVDILKEKVEEKRQHIAKLEGVSKMLSSEVADAVSQEQQLKLSNQQQLADAKAQIDSVAAQRQQEYEEHLASFKREAALRVKAARSEIQAGVDSKLKAQDEQADAFEKQTQAQLVELQQQIKLLQSRIGEADKQSEQVYAHDREQWKIKRKEELEAKGVRSQLTKVQEQLAQVQQKSESLETQEKQLKTQLKAEAKEKLLMAARLKNLHNKMEAIKQQEDQLKAKNTNLKHEIQEIQLTQSENAGAVNSMKGDLEKRTVQAVEQAKAKAEANAKHFEDSKLNQAKAEIEALQSQIKVKETHNAQLETQLLQEEHNIQAEKTEADSTLAKAQADAQKAETQIAIELDKAREKSRQIVDDARRRAARVREDARAAGMAQAEAQMAAKKNAQQEREQTLVQEATQTKLLEKEFVDKAAAQVKDLDMLLQTKFVKESQEMQTRVHDEVYGQLEQAKNDFETNTQKITTDLHHTQSLIETREKQISETSKQNEILKHSIQELQQELERQKSELTTQQVMFGHI